MKKAKAIVLLSGGLDSILAIRVLQEQGIEVIGLSFESPFFKSEKAKNAAKQAGITLMIVKLGKEYINLIKNPPHGYGSAINPCIDCHALMIKKANGMIKKLDADFIATGEVLNERPMSQNLESLKIVENESGLKGKLLRPLSAKHLEETEAEKKGLVDREKLLDIKGRSRDKQILLAKKWNLSYPTPGGGCLLCEKDMKKKLSDLFGHNEIDEASLELLKIGRHFRSKGKIVVGRNHQENNLLEKIGKNWIKMECKDHLGPVTILQNKEDLNKAAQLTAFYAKAPNDIKITFWKKARNKSKELETSKISEDEINEFKI